MTLSQAILKHALSRPFRYFERVDSTNDLAKEWLMAGAAEGAAIIANEQMRGRGRKRDRSWRTPPNVALALSVILRPPEVYLPRVNMVGALSVYDLAQSVGCDNVGIKWPNDVQVNGKKISGVLPEIVWDKGGLIGVVLGIGVNVRVSFCDTELRERAINLEDISEKRLDRSKLLAELLQRIDHWYGRIATPAVFSNWKDRLNMLNQQVKAEEIEGFALDVKTDGALLLRDKMGAIHEIRAGDVIVPAPIGKR